jgi:CubicO group peptidase (beta-lactamase class C family)
MKDVSEEARGTDLPIRKGGLDTDALGRLDACIQRYIDNGDHFGASIVVARGGVVAHRRSFGTSAPGRPAAEDDLFCAMSLTKSFTAALVLRAIDQGRFTLDTRVAEIVPVFASGGKQNVTVRQLLNHTGGAYASILPAPPSLQPMELGDLAKTSAAFSAMPAAYAPGTRCVYSPLAGIGVLGHMLVLTDPAKRSFRDIAREDLFEPLGMVDTRFGGPKNEPRRVPMSYTPKLSNPGPEALAKYLDALFDEPSEVPAGNAFTTVDDVFRFAEVLRLRGDNGKFRLMSQALCDYGTQNHTGDMKSAAWDFYTEAHGLPEFPANFSLLGGYSRGTGHHMTGAGCTASSRAFYAVGGGSTMYMVDPARDLTFVFLSAGFIDGLAHLQRLCRLSDLALAACVD